MMDSNKTRHEDKRILNRSFQPARGPGLPEGTLLRISKAAPGAYEVDYTTPYGAYGQFVVNQEDLVNLRNLSRQQ